MKKFICSCVCALVPMLLPGAIITVNTVNNVSPGAGQVSLFQALTAVQSSDTILFNIAGAGPHVIVTPIGGYPLITADNVTIDGYSQPGSSPNTNPILGGNNAQIKIVLDSTGTDTAENPGFPERPLRRSTRLDFPAFDGNTGYGESENAILGVFEADNVTIRGLSFLARHTAGDENDPSIYCVALVRQATNAHVNGCWFGLPPGGTAMAQLRPAASAVAAFRWRIGGDVYSEGLRFGTDGNGVNDRAEFNIALGCRIALALELPRAKVSGNYLNVFPNGLTFVDVEAIYDQVFAFDDEATVEIFENGRVTDNTVFGTDGDGVSDSDERNIAAHPVYDHDIEFYTSAVDVVVAGNYIGVGVDGITASPVPTSKTPDFIELPGTGSLRIGSNGDGVSDALEGNLIVNVPGQVYAGAGSGVPIVNRRNTLVSNKFKGVPFADGQGRQYASYYASVVADTSLVVPVLNTITNNVLSGTMTGPTGEYVDGFIDLYTVDPVALKNNAYWPDAVVHPQRWLASYTDGGPGDLNPAAGAFAFDISTFGVSDTTHLTVTVTYSKDFDGSNVGRAVTGPTAAPVSRRPTIGIRTEVDKAIVWWFGRPDAYFAEQNETLNPNTWVTLIDATYAGGRNIVEYPFAFSSLPMSFFRLVSQ